MSRLSHSFSVEYAELYGIECAILINHFQFWIDQNQAMGRNFHDGRTWMYQTQKEIASIYPYWTEDVVFKHIKKLIDVGVLVKGNYNKTPFDKTSWYAFENQKKFTKPSNDGIETVEQRNQKPSNDGIRNRQMTEPIPDTKTDTKKEQQQAAAVSLHSSEKEQPNEMRTKSVQPKIYECLLKVDIPQDQKTEITNKYSEEIVKNAVEFSMANKNKIKTSLVAYLKMSCEKGLKIEIKAIKENNPNEVSEEQQFSNKKMAENYRKEHWETKGRQIQDLGDHLRVGNDILYFKDVKFIELFNHYIRKLR